jgi:UDP-glucose 4-epimerase
VKVLITGGAGYIGSTISSCLSDNGITSVILDSLVKGKKEFTSDRIFYEGDIADVGLIGKILHDHPDVEYVIHCAARIVVPESVQEPYLYYRENVCKPLEMFNALRKTSVRKIIFSSSASIYKGNDEQKFDENVELYANCPYAYTKIVVERLLEDFCRAYGFQCICLRYFNPIGADPKMRSGPYDPNPSHLLGSLVEVASRRKSQFELNGTKWETRDGTAIRDYVHVWDLALAHTAAVKQFDEVISKSKNDYSVMNLGSDNGVTVKEFVTAFERVIGRTIPKVETDPRPGDGIGGYAVSSKARTVMGWESLKTVEEGIRDALAWNKKRIDLLGY